VARHLLLLFCAAALGCENLTGPSEPSLQATLYYPSGDSLRVSGSNGYWFFESPTAALVVAFTAGAPAGDAAHPSLTSVQFHLAGPAFASFPTNHSQPLGTVNGNGVGAQVQSPTGLYRVDSGTVAVTALPGDYARVAFTAWCASAVPPYTPAFRVVGVTEVPRGTN
jgi:hypothetical protein